MQWQDGAKAAGYTTCGPVVKGKTRSMQRRSPTAIWLSDCAGRPERIAPTGCSSLTQHIIMKSTLLFALCAFSIAGPLTSCREKGPAEKAGENLDKAAENVKDAINPKGPAEKVGEKIDDAVN